MTKRLDVVYVILKKRPGPEGTQRHFSPVSRFRFVTRCITLNLFHCRRFYGVMVECDSLVWWNLTAEDIIVLLPENWNPARDGGFSERRLFLHCCFFSKAHSGNETMLKCNLYMCFLTNLTSRACMCVHKISI